MAFSFSLFIISLLTLLLLIVVIRLSHWFCAHAYQTCWMPHSMRFLRHLQLVRLFFTSSFLHLTISSVFVALHFIRSLFLLASILFHFISLWIRANVNMLIVHRCCECLQDACSVHVHTCCTSRKQKRRNFTFFRVSSDNDKHQRLVFLKWKYNSLCKWIWKEKEQ